jgi:uncharacterized protein (TIGR02145 family)
MAIGNRQIGWSQEENLLWEISKQLDRMDSIMCTGDCPTSTTTTSTTIAPITTTTTTTEAIPSILIGDQTWILRNLEVVTYANGDPIPEVQGATAWKALTTGAWCYYNNDPANGPIYGKIYNWYAVNDPRGLAPLGQHVPTDTEWTTLTTFLGGLTVAGGKLKEVGTTNWNAPNTDATNISGFTALPGGYRYNIGPFSNIGYIGYWWTSSEYDTPNARYQYLASNTGTAFSFSSNKKLGFSVRCLID